MWKREHPLSSKADAFNAKLAPKFRGPLEVRKIISPVIVDLRDRHGRWTRHIHVQDLKPAPRDEDQEGDTEDDTEAGNDVDVPPENNDKPNQNTEDEGDEEEQ